MATIRERKSKWYGKRYQAVVELAGMPIQRETFATKTEAKIWSQRVESSARSGAVLPTRDEKSYTVSRLFDRYLEQLAKDSSPHLAKRRQQLQWWRGQIGDYSLTRVTPAVIAECRDRLVGAATVRGTPRTPATANRYLAALSKVFSLASKEWQLMAGNPVKAVSRKREPQGRVRYLSDVERLRLMHACAQSELPELPLVVLLALTTGMRRGEILGLRWADVSLERRLIVIHKTKNSERRSVPIVPLAAEHLETHSKIRRLDSDLVFCRAGGRIVNIESAFYAALIAAKIEDFRFHDLRHTAASYLAMSGATTAEIAAVLGHKTLAMVKRYAHLSDQHTEKVVNRMTDKYFGND